MAENLVEALRLNVEYRQADNALANASRAADAIEELEEKAQAYAETLYAYEHPWIPVTERLPEQRINPHTHDFEYVLCATIWGDVRPFKYGTPIGQIEAHFWNGAGYEDAYITHWMPLPKPPKMDESEDDGMEDKNEHTD